MKREEKLKIAIDFIADYLSPALPVEKVTEDVENTNENVLVETESEDHLKDEDILDKHYIDVERAYKLMKKLEARDIENAKINHEVKKAVDPFKEELAKMKERVRAEHEAMSIEEERLIERNKEDSEVGVTIDKLTGNMVKVAVESLPSLHEAEESIKNMINTPINTETVDLTDTEIEVEFPLTHNED